MEEKGERECEVDESGEGAEGGVERAERRDPGECVQCSSIANSWTFQYHYVLESERECTLLLMLNPNTTTVIIITELLTSPRVPITIIK